jgi:proteasome assembly chaperone (PAC2) family protein
MLEDLKKPWLVAAWPGMGGVAQIAAAYLVRQLAARPLAELDPSHFFETPSIRIKGGLIQPSELPRSVFHAWRNPGGAHDLIVMLGQQQPENARDRYCSALVDVAVKFGVERVFTFAAMATPIHPSAEPRVFAACTREELLPDLRRDGITLLEEAEITGLNGVFLAAAAKRELPGLCLLGEFPFFAAGVPHPRASAAVLRIFSELAGIQLDMTDLLADAATIERNLIQHLERAQRAAQERKEEPEEETESALDEALEQDGEPRIAPEVVERIEQLFVQARADRAKAVELKAQLDRHGLFKQYEDRFLDLFKHAG